MSDAGDVRVWSLHDGDSVWLFCQKKSADGSARRLRVQLPVDEIRSDVMLAVVRAGLDFYTGLALYDTVDPRDLIDKIDKAVSSALDAYEETVEHNDEHNDD